MNFEEWMKTLYKGESDWDEGWNRGNMEEAFDAGRASVLKKPKFKLKEDENGNATPSSINGK